MIISRRLIHKYLIIQSFIGHLYILNLFAVLKHQLVLSELSILHAAHYLRIDVALFCFVSRFVLIP